MDFAIIFGVYKPKIEVRRYFFVRLVTDTRKFIDKY